MEELLAPLPPVILRFGASEQMSAGEANQVQSIPWKQEDAARVAVVGMEWHGGAPDWSTWVSRSSSLGAVAREVLLTSVIINPKLNVTLDGGTWAGASGVRVSAERSSLFNGQTRYEHSRPFEWVWLEAGDCVRSYCARKRPDDEGFYSLALWGLQSRRHGATKLHELTREPERLNRADVDDAEAPERDERPQPTGGPTVFTMTESQRQAEQRTNEEHAAAVREGVGAEAVTTWADRRTRQLSPKNGQIAWITRYESNLDNPEELPKAPHSIGPVGRPGIEIPLEQATFVRMPAVPEMSRALPDAVWGDMDIMSHACLCVLHAAMRTGEALFSRALQVCERPRPRSGRSGQGGSAGTPSKRASRRSPSKRSPQNADKVTYLLSTTVLLTTRLTPFSRALPQNQLESYPTSGVVHKAVDDHLNTALKRLGMRPVKGNPDTKKVYATCMDGTQVEHWMDDLFEGLVKETPATDDFGLERSSSIFLSGVAKACKQYANKGGSSDYASLVKALPVLRHWATAFRLAMRMRPEPEDYALAKTHLALYVASKLLLWPSSNTWYDNECLYTLGSQHEKWGSLRLMSQEGMEAWQKKLNELLRTGNGFANAGAIPKSEKRKGKAAVAAYMARRDADRPNSAQWVYEQAMVQQHAYSTDVYAQRDALRQSGKVVGWKDFDTWWKRYMVCAALRCRLRARVRRWQHKRPNEAVRGRVQAPAGYYRRLLEDHRSYWADSPLSADDLADDEMRRQLRTARRERWRKGAEERAEHDRCATPR